MSLTLNEFSFRSSVLCHFFVAFILFHINMVFIVSPHFYFVISVHSQLPLLAFFLALVSVVGVYKLLLGSAISFSLLSLILFLLFLFVFRL